MLVRVWQKTVEDEKIRVFVFRQLENNYSYIVENHGMAIIIDPAESGELIEALNAAHLELKAVLLTHYHEDHVKGVKGLIEAVPAQLIGPFGGEEVGVDSFVSGQEEIIIGPFSITAIATPGHVGNHLCYLLSEFMILFSGDMLFPCGCGKILNGCYQEMLESLKALKSLHPDTLIFSGHEYSIENLEFALSIEPHKQEIKNRLEMIASHDQYPVPTSLALELQLNPFFKTDDPEFRKNLNLASASELETLIKLREFKEQRKNG
jgi:hydroxyacylglutathione hydrolase